METEKNFTKCVECSKEIDEIKLDRDDECRICKAHDEANNIGV